MRCLLDTNIVIAISKGAASLKLWLQRCPASDLVLSSAVLAEIERGIAKSNRKQHNRKVYDALLADFATLPFDAAQARVNQLTLVTDNSDEFLRVAGLGVENWLRRARP